MKFLKSMLMIIAALSIAACTGSPGTADLETQVKPKLASPFWDVVSIKKLDGKMDDSAKQLGVKAYTVKYECEVKFKKGLADLRADIKKEQDAERKKAQEAQAKSAKSGSMDDLIDAASATFGAAMNSAMSGKSMKLDELEAKYGDFKTGETKKLTDTCSFEKTDKGWTLINFTM